METINKIELRDENIYPDETVLSKILGQSYKAYTALLELFQKYELNYEWRYYRDGKAWLCKVQKKKKTIVWMSAWKGYMQATIYFPLRLLENVLELEISEELKEKITNTKNVGKSIPCIFEVRSNEILVDFEKVMEFKIISK
jgi:hypothetical protein